MRERSDLPWASRVSLRSRTTAASNGSPENAAAQAAYKLDAVITMVDAKHIIMHLDEDRPEGVENESGGVAAAAHKGWWLLLLTQ